MAMTLCELDDTATAGRGYLDRNLFILMLSNTNFCQRCKTLEYHSLPFDN